MNCLSVCYVEADAGCGGRDNGIHQRKRFGVKDGMILMADFLIRKVLRIEFVYLSVCLWVCIGRSNMHSVIELLYCNQPSISFSNNPEWEWLLGSGHNSRAESSVFGGWDALKSFNRSALLISCTPSPHSSPPQKGSKGRRKAISLLEA